MTSHIDWAGLFWEARGFLGLDDDEPVPRDELIEQVKVNGWCDRQVREALREADSVESAGDRPDSGLVLAEGADEDKLNVAISNPTEPGSPDAKKPADGTESELPHDSESSQISGAGNDGRWAAADFSAPKSGIWPPELLELEQWMGHVEKKPFAPWADRDHPEADHDEDARWKWGLEKNYVDGETLEKVEVDPRLDGRAFLQQTEDPYVHVDGDDVRDPETGEVHPAFVAILEHLGLTYADVSQSGAGVHAYYRGDLPDRVKQASWQLDDEPWGANDELPSIELYPGKRVCVATGEHVPGTPTEIHPWNDDVLEPLLEANDEVATRQRDRPDVTAARDDYDPRAYEAGATRSDESTSDIRDVFAAIDRLDARRVAERTIVADWNDEASTSDGKRAFYPTWGRNSNGTANVVDETIWQDTGELGGYGGPVVMALIHSGDIQPQNAAPPRGELWWQGVDQLRELGFDIPAYSLSDKGQPVAVLPGTPKARTREWDWRNTGEDAQPTLTVADARERTKARIRDAYRYGDQVLVEALPTMGKSDGSVAAAAEADIPVTLLTTRGHKEQYAQLREWCDEHALKAYTLPSFTHDCDTANGEYGEDWRDRVMDWYQRGATPKEIHMHAEEVLGHPLPCQAHEGHECPYTAKWRFNPDDYDALIGHYSHAHKPKVTRGRAVVFDEFPGDTYETRLDTALAGAVTAYLQATPELPYEDYTDLIEHRDDEQRRADALAWFQDQDLERDGLQVFDDTAGHAVAPLAVFTLLAGVGDDLGNGWERADLGEHGIGLHNRERGAVYVLSPPPLEYTRSIVALDGTPTPALWERTLGVRLNHRSVLTDDERAEYIRDVLGLNLVRTTEAVKPYNSADHVSVDRDASLLEAIGEQHDTRPAVITTATAEHEYEQAELLDLVAETEHYGNVLGSNAFSETRVGAVIGSNHYGDQYIEKWGAYESDPVARGEGKGADLSYGDFGDRVLTHMREHETLQAAMRFGRDGNGATVYIHTDTLPEWVPVADEGRVVSTWSDGMREVLAAAETLEEWTTAELADMVSITERQVREHCHGLVERGVLTAEYDGRGYVWRDDGLHRVSEHGEVELGTVDTTAPETSVVTEVGRSSSYTWAFRNSLADGAAPPEAGRSHGEEPAAATSQQRLAAFNGGDRPPDDGG